MLVVNSYNNFYIIVIYNNNKYRFIFYIISLVGKAITFLCVNFVANNKTINKYFQKQNLTHSLDNTPENRVKFK